MLVVYPVLMVEVDRNGICRYGYRAAQGQQILFVCSQCPLAVFLH